MHEGAEMGNRSKYVALTAAATAVALSARRRSRLRRVLEGAAFDLDAPVTGRPSDRETGIDEAHAPGHRHLRLPVDEGLPAGTGGHRLEGTKRRWEPFKPR